MLNRFARSFEDIKITNSHTERFLWRSQFKPHKITREYLLLGDIAIGAGIHGYVQIDFIVQYAGVNNPLAVCATAF